MRWRPVQRGADRLTHEGGIGDDTGADGAQSSQDAAPDSPPIEAGQDAAMDGALDAAIDTGAPDAPVEAGRTCLLDLSNVGLRDFRISFTLTTLAGSVYMALVNQRSGCNQTSAWWSISYIPSTATTGGLAVATDDGNTANYIIQEQAGAAVYRRRRTAHHPGLACGWQTATDG